MLKWYGSTRAASGRSASYPRLPGEVKRLKCVKPRPASVPHQPLRASRPRRNRHDLERRLVADRDVGVDGFALVRVALQFGTLQGAEEPTASYLRQDSGVVKVARPAGQATDAKLVR